MLYFSLASIWLVAKFVLPKLQNALFAEITFKTEWTYLYEHDLDLQVYLLSSTT